VKGPAPSAKHELILALLQIGLAIAVNLDNVESQIPVPVIAVEFDGRPRQYPDEYRRSAYEIAAEIVFEGSKINALR
jgi:hypothetical protein